MFSTTTFLCNALNLPYFSDLPVLSDIDHPEDLEVWKAELRKLTQGDNPISTPKISVIVPVLNEDKHIWETLASISYGVNIEIIVVDGQSSDNTINVINQFKEKLENYIQIPKQSYAHFIQKDENMMLKEKLTSREFVDIKIIQLSKEERGRSTQQNKGVAHSTGEYILFVHGKHFNLFIQFNKGDTILPRGYDLFIRECLSRNGGKKTLGAFTFEIEDKKGEMSRNGRLLTQFTTNLRAKYLQLPYGDQV